jgi:hypothetical protein
VLLLVALYFLFAGFSYDILKPLAAICLTASIVVPVNQYYTMTPRLKLSSKRQLSCSGLGSFLLLLFLLGRFMQLFRFLTFSSLSPTVQVILFVLIICIAIFIYFIGYTIMLRLLARQIRDKRRQS